LYDLKSTCPGSHLHKYIAHSILAFAIMANAPFGVRFHVVQQLGILCPQKMVLECRVLRHFFQDGYHHCGTAAFPAQVGAWNCLSGDLLGLGW